MSKNNKKLRPSVSNTKNPIHIELLKIEVKNSNQQNLVDTIENTQFTFVTGRAGTGKTHIALKMGVKALLEKRVRKLVLIRPTVTSGENIGFLPGDLMEKLNPFHQAIYDILDRQMSRIDIAGMFEDGRICIEGIGFLRGRTFNDSFVIVDEAQNTTPKQMELILSRIGENTKVVVCGDIKQTDLKDGQDGLSNAVALLCGDCRPEFAHICLTGCVRNPIIDYILDKYESYLQSLKK